MNISQNELRCARSYNECMELYGNEDRYLIEEEKHSSRGIWGVLILILIFITSGGSKAISDETKIKQDESRISKNVL